MAAAKYVIIGAGFAGASTAYHLARRGARDIVIVEQEAAPGLHSSGRNAAMVRQVVPDPAVAALARAGAAFLCNLPSDWPAPVAFRRSGSLLLGSGEKWEALRRDAERSRQAGTEIEIWSSALAKSRVAILKETDFEGAIWCPSDGVADIQGLLAGYLQAAEALGVEIRYGTAVRGFETKNGRLEAVVTDQEPLRGETFINAAGAWARKIGEMAGALPVPLRPCRRHLFLTPPLAWIDPEWPFVWDVTHDIYFRPEAGGLLLSPCDQDEMDPGIPPTDARIVELLSEKVRLCCPSLVEAPIKSSWAGLRTLSADGRFVIGWDARAHGFFWVAGLGGHGVTASAAVGALSASLILGGPEKGTKIDGEFSPKRFVS